MFSGIINTLTSCILTLSLILKVTAIPCDTNEDFYNFNSSKTVQIPALRLTTLGSDRTRVVEDPDNSWYFAARTRSEDLSGNENEMTNIWLNTGNRNATGIGACVQTTWTYGLNGFSFSRDVLERSIDDTGDCKIMMGEDCTAALERQYIGFAMHSAFSGSCDFRQFTSTIPQECTSLVDGGSEWRGGTFSSAIDLDFALDKQTLVGEGCPNASVAINSSMHGGSGTGGGYNETIRFPQPYVLTFWPNQTGETITSGSDVRVKLLCLRTDDIEEGSLVPGSAQDILDQNTVKYAGNATDKPKDHSSTESVAAMRTMAPYLSIAAMAGLLLV